MAKKACCARIDRIARRTARLVRQNNRQMARLEATGTKPARIKPVKVKPITGIKPIKASDRKPCHCADPTKIVHVDIRRQTR